MISGRMQQFAVVDVKVEVREEQRRLVALLLVPAPPQRAPLLLRCPPLLDAAVSGARGVVTVEGFAGDLADVQE